MSELTICRSLEEINTFTSVKQMSLVLRQNGCTRCKLGRQADLQAPVVYRGNPEAGVCLFGEAPGREEDLHGSPFVGPAGELLDRIFASVGLDTEKDLYIGNLVKCRPIAPKNSGKQNLSPLKETLDACRPYFEKELELLRPRLVILAGLPAVRSALGSKFAGGKNMYDLSGHLFLRAEEFGPIPFFVIYHPAALLHSQRDPDRSSIYRQKMWLHVRMIKNQVDRIKGRSISYPEVEVEE